MPLAGARLEGVLRRAFRLPGGCDIGRVLRQVMDCLHTVNATKVKRCRRGALLLADFRMHREEEDGSWKVALSWSRRARKVWKVLEIDFDRSPQHLAASRILRFQVHRYADHRKLLKLLADLSTDAQDQDHQLPR